MTRAVNVLHHRRRRSTGNLAHEAVSAVEMHLLQKGWPVGEALGAFPDVQKGLGLGRPACREAMIILEARGSLTSGGVRAEGCLSLPLRRRMWSEPF